MTRPRHARWTSLLPLALLLADCGGGTTPGSDVADDDGHPAGDVLDADAAADGDAAGESVADGAGDVPDDAGGEEEDAPADAARDTPADGAVDADDGSAAELSCSEALACIEACAGDVPCVMDCYARICDSHIPLVEDIMACATDACATECGDPSAPECLSCVYDACAEEIADCEASTECCC